VAAAADTRAAFAISTFRWSMASRRCAGCTGKRDLRAIEEPSGGGQARAIPDAGTDVPTIIRPASSPSPWLAAESADPEAAQKSHLATILANILAKFVYEPLARDGGNLDVRFLIWVGRGNSPAKRLRSAWAMCMVQRRGFALVATWIWGGDDQIKHRAAGRR
jgi:hypothetical protein